MSLPPRPGVTHAMSRLSAGAPLPPIATVVPKRVLVRNIGDLCAGAADILV
jgi:hypothetical protein